MMNYHQNILSKEVVFLREHNKIALKNKKSIEARSGTLSPLNQMITIEKNLYLTNYNFWLGSYIEAYE